MGREEEGRFGWWNEWNELEERQIKAAKPFPIDRILNADLGEEWPGKAKALFQAIL